MLSDFPALTSHSSVNKKHVAVIGGGLVGALNACFLAKRGFVVDLYEAREDIRTADVVRGRSFNLALSERGRAALRAVGLEDEIMKRGIPMHARMIHDPDGTKRPIPYGTAGQCIISVRRRVLNEVLLTAAENQYHVTIHFQHKLKSCRFETGELEFQRPNGKIVKASADLIMGTDGAYSTVRWQMMKSIRLDYCQEYISHGYIELSMPPTPDDKFAMETNYLHIWPRNNYMMIALPNLDKSFSCPLLMPFQMFDSIKNERDLRNFFMENHSDAIPLVGWDRLKEIYFSAKPRPFISIKCYPYHVEDRAVIIGDAAHAMVPFYGQGMNCGFEDCLLFDELLDKYNNDFAVALPAFSELRSPDAKAMCDLAMYNYIEMRESVNSRLFMIRKRLDNALHWLMPSTWVPLYTMVSFSRIRYHECIERKEWQDRVLSRTVYSALILMTLGGALLVYKCVRNPDLDIGKTFSCVTKALP